METKKSINFVSLICAIIIGVALYKLYDFDNHKFEKTGLAIVYGIGLLFALITLVKTSNKAA